MQGVGFVKPPIGEGVVGEPLPERRKRRFEREPVDVGASVSQAPQIRQHGAHRAACVVQIAEGKASVEEKIQRKNAAATVSMP